MFLSMMIVCIKQHLSNMKNLRNTEAELKKALLIKKACSKSGNPESLKK